MTYENEINPTARCQILKIITVGQYPNGEIKTIPIGMEGIKLIVFDPKEIEKRLIDLEVDLESWNTGDWKENPSILIERTDGLVILYSKYSGHYHIPGRCFPAGPVVYPDGVQNLDGGTLLTL